MSKLKSSEAKKNTSANLAPPATRKNIDKISREVLALLQKDGRRSYSSIARELNVSEGAIRSRVAYLEKHEHLRFLTIVDPIRIGYECWAMLGFNLLAGVSPNEFAQQLSKEIKVIWVSVIGGEFDLMAEVWTKTQTELQEFLEITCYGNSNVLSVDTMVGIQLYKRAGLELS
ncbi:MAG: Lrp/AsnC family transcriptional regulator for asnA, asnC and gidA [Candidatus Azotimanducaceae bacterium]|jgi:Lrp/AsnC family transcriptional regulator for asnA, asnC and gidA